MSNNIKFGEINIIYTEEFNLFNLLDWFSELKLNKIIFTVDNKNIDIINYTLNNHYMDHTKKCGYPIPLYIYHNKEIYFDSLIKNITSNVFNNHLEYKNIIESKYDCEFKDPANNTIFALRQIKTNSNKYTRIILAYDSEIINFDFLIYLIKFICIDN